MINGFRIKPSKELSKGERIPLNLEEVMMGAQPTGFYVSTEDYEKIKDKLKGDRK